MLKIVVTGFILFIHIIYAEEIKSFGFNSIILGDSPKGLMGNIYGEEMTIISGKGVSVPSYTKTLMYQLPFESISVNTTPHSKLIYTISPNFKDNYFNSFTECKVFMEEAIKQIKVQHDNVYVELSVKNDGNYYSVSNSLNQNIFLYCLKGKTITASISFVDKELERKILVEYDEMENIQNRKKEILRQQDKSKSLELFN